MGYYFRAFCTSGDVPALGDVLSWVRDRGVNVSADRSSWGDDPVVIHYDRELPPFTAEVNRTDDPESLGAQERDEFLSMVEEIQKTPRKRAQVATHLRDTKFIVACEIPVEGFDDPGFHALDIFLAYFMVHHGAMIQADGQGFYDNGRLVLELAA